LFVVIAVTVLDPVDGDDDGPLENITEPVTDESGEVSDMAGEVVVASIVVDAESAGLFFTLKKSRHLKKLLTYNLNSRSRAICRRLLS
jgi:hypothetical protein